MKKLFTLLFLTACFLGKSVTAQTTCNLVANFNPIFAAGTANLVYFQNTSTPVNQSDSAHWIFGDGTQSNTYNTSHTYAQPGTYTVCLRMQQRNPNGILTNCVSEICHTVVVQNSTACNLVANFTTTPVTSMPNAFVFTNTSTPSNPSDSIRWTFGDGTSGTGSTITHVYTQPGTFNVCLRVQQRDASGALTNCIRETCHTVAVTLPTTCNLVANFTITPVTATPNAFHFTNTSVPLNNTDSIRWTFGDGTFSNDPNPTHTYTQNGTFNVCLRVQQRNSNGVLTNCIKEICHTVAVTLPTPCNLLANFNTTIAAGTVNTVYFQNTTTPVNTTDSVRWTFGDGTESHSYNTTHTYAQAGTYTVCLRMQQRNPNGGLTNCVSEICHTVVIQNSTACNLVANFTIAPVTSAANAFVFTNTSTPSNPTDSIRWTFGDGTSGTGSVITHVYTQSGTYNVCLRVQQRDASGALTNCIRETCHPVTVVIPTTCNLVANFTITPLTGTPTGNAFVFTNTSTPSNPTDSIRWTFGDGTSGTGSVTTHVYTQPGTFNVCLRVQQRNSNGTLSNCIREICHPVTVTLPTTCNLLANFTSTVAAPTTTVPPFIVHFQNTSTPLNATDSIRWTFGDGTSSNDVNPTHTYTAPGTYNVCLRVQQRTLAGGLTNCIREVCHTIILPVPSTCNLLANFTITPITATANTFHFENTSSGMNSTDSIRWTFGDGTSSNQVSPNHTYAQPGTYNVCLRIIKRSTTGVLTNCVSEKCLTVIVQGPNTCNLVANFTSTILPNVPPGGPYIIQFHNASTPMSTTDSIRWTFGDGSSSNDPNPIHTYTQPGSYNVCLRVQQRNPAGGLTNCVREVCHVIYVPVPPTICNLLANFYAYRILVSGTALPYLYHFENTSTGFNNTDSIRWTFGDGTSSNQVSPNHAYNAPGTYNVCLRIIRRTSAGILTNCVSEICHPVVVVPQNPNVCNLQPFPNPVNTSVTVNVVLGLPQMIDVYIYNAMNTLVKEKHQAGVAGNNLVTVGTADLPQGIYIMKVIHGGDVCYATFVKL